MKRERQLFAKDCAIFSLQIPRLINPVCLFLWLSAEHTLLQILVRIEAVWVGELEIALIGGKLKNSGARIPGENFCGVIVGRGLEVEQPQIVDFETL